MPSDVWNIFIKTKDGGKCKLCQVCLKTSGNTTNLRKHLKRRHPDFSLTEVEKIKVSKAVDIKIAHLHFFYFNLAQKM